MPNSVLSIDELDDFGSFFRDVYAACALQGVPANSAIAENGIGQFEINLMHVDDPLRAADDAVLFKRIVKGVARKHGFAASFMAKPYGGRSGSGLHVHFSLLDKNDINVFDNGRDEGSSMLRHAVGGLLEAMAETTILFAPHFNSYRRLRPGAHAPSAAAWGYENRTVAVRIPGGSPKARRIEHHVAGADANPYLVLTGILAGALVGIEREIVPTRPGSGQRLQCQAQGPASRLGERHRCLRLGAYRRSNPAFDAAGHARCLQASGNDDLRGAGDGLRIRDLSRYGVKRPPRRGPPDVIAYPPSCSRQRTGSGRLVAATPIFWISISELRREGGHGSPCVETVSGRNAMATLTVTQSHIYSGETLTNIDQIVFSTTGFSTATFEAFQFGPGLISDTVNIVGDANTNAISIGMEDANGTVTSFSAAGWTFTNWSPFPNSITIFGSSGNDTITGSSQDDEIFGNPGDDHLIGGAGTDILLGGTGGDTLEGGAGDDIYELTDVHRSDFLFFFDSVVEAADGGTDRVDVQRAGIFGSYTLAPNVENGSVIGIESFNLSGNELANRLFGNNANNFLGGGGGNDTLIGFGGDDFLRGGVGANSLDGAADTDTLTYDTSNAAVVVNLLTGAASGGDAKGDTFFNMENLRGSNFDDRLTGDIGANTIDGGGGDDTIEGGGGANSLLGGLGANTLSYVNSPDAVFIDFTALTVGGGDASGDTFQDFANITGSSFNDTLTGDGNANALKGNGGDDLLKGAAGNDDLSGGAGGDRLAGGTGRDLITGGTGQDTMTGNGGSDTFIFNTVAEIGKTAATRDVITDFTEGGDKIDLSAIDADKSLAGNQVFHFIGAGAFTSVLTHSCTSVY